MSVQHSISHSLLSLKLTERRTLSPALELLDAGYDSTEHGVTLEEDMQSPQHNIQMCRCRSPLCGLVGLLARWSQSHQHSEHISLGS